MVACAKDEPEINVKLIVTNLSDKEFESIGTFGLNNPIKEDLKNIKFTLHIKHSNNIKNRKVIIPDFQNAFNSFDEEKYWFGPSFKQDNPQEKFAKYKNEIVLYAKGLDEQDIKNIFKSEKVKISWTTKYSDYEEKVINLGDIIQFK
jgi:hypothetical protein